MAHDIFLSYARVDQDRVSPYIAHLEGLGLVVWIDTKGIEGATEWRSEIVDAIKGTPLVLAMFTESSVSSENVQRELVLASEAGVPILPVCLEHVTMPPSLEYVLAGRQRIEAGHLEFRDGIDAILKAIERVQGGLPESGETRGTREEVARRGAERRGEPRPRGFVKGAVSDFSRLSRECQFALIFAFVGAPAWFLLLLAFAIGPSVWEPIVSPLKYLFALGFVLNVAGLVMAMRGLKQGSDPASVLWLALIVNAGEALSVLGFLLMT